MSKKIDEHFLLECFFREPREWHLREIARATRMNPTTASKYLEEYVKKGLLRKKEERGNMLYSVTEHPLLKMEKRHWNEKRIRESGLLQYLEEELSYPTIILFGSVAKGEDHQASDIDLFILAEEKKQLDLSRYERKLKKSIQLFLHTPKEFHELRKTSKELINNVLNGLLLSGFLEVI